MRPGTVQRLAVEFLGTLFLVFFGAGAATIGASLVGVALAHAFTLTLIVWLFGAVSGAHVNPAVTISLALRNRLPWLDAALYIGAQLVGAVVGAALLWGIYSGTGIDRGLGATHVGGGVNIGGALLAEIVGTFLLVSTVYLAGVGERVPPGFAALAIGLALGAAILAVGPASGASLNPARTFGPELILAIGGGAAQWSHIWIYLVGPVVGGALAVFAADLVDPDQRTSLPPTGTDPRPSRA